VVTGLTNSPDFATHPACEREDYFLPFLVVFFAEDFLVVAFFFLAAMALGTSFLMRTVKVEKFFVNDFLLACHFFLALRSRASCAPRAMRDKKTATAKTRRARRNGGR
jgi:hypothetical protein